ncbi:MAG: DNA polymerase III subunit delta [Muribaculaceae bacterium]|nr:DNA polymerase III subunit delta [Muribaculaceae bacterium]
MAVKRDTVTFTTLNKEIKEGKYRSIYILQGEEPYYMERLQQLIIDTALTEDQRDFNLSIYYGNTANVRDVISSCRQYPAFSERKVVVVREAQLIPKQPGHKDDFDLFASYAEKPLPSTILVICHKGGALKSKPFTDALKAAKSGVVFDSNKVKEGRDLEGLIVNYANSLGCNIDTKATSMLADHIGTDIARLFSELDKLSILAEGQSVEQEAQGNKSITPLLIEQNIGISKDFNNFELEDALCKRNAEKAFRIVDYFERNPKNNPSVVSVAVLFSFFSNVLLAATARDKSIDNIMAIIGTRSQWRARKFLEATRTYNIQSLVNIIGYLRECDTRSKGIGSRQDQYALLKELIYKILHS